MMSEAAKKCKNLAAIINGDSNEVSQSNKSNFEPHSKSSGREKKVLK